MNNCLIGKKVILYFTQNPYPGKTGTHKRCLAIIDAFQQLGCRITFLSHAEYGPYSWDQESRQYFEEKNVEVILYQSSPADQAFMAQAQLENQDVLNLAYHCPPGLAGLFKNTYESLKPDVVFIFYAYSSGLLQVINTTECLTIVDSIDLVSLSSMLQQKLLPFLGASPYNPLHTDPAVVKEDFFQQFDLSPSKQEFELYDLYDCTFTVSQHEAEILVKNTHRTKVVYLPITCSSPNTRNSYMGNPVFVAANNPFNIQAYLYLTSRVMPLLTQIDPNLRVRVVGEIEQNLIKADGIDLLGFVPDLSDVYATASCAVCPIIGGTGMSVKVVEAMAHGVPVVVLGNSTQESLIRHGIDGFIAHDAKEFACYVALLCQDKALSASMGAAARQFVLQCFSDRQLVQRLENVLHHVVRNDTCSPSRRIKVLYDISVLGLSVDHNTARTGIFRVVEHVAHGLAESPEIDLVFCSTQALIQYAPHTENACRRYLAEHPEFSHVPFCGTSLPAADIFHSPFHGLPDEVSIPIRFLTVYDLIPVLFPHFVPDQSVQLQKHTLQQLRSDDRCLCISQATKSDLCTYLDMPQEKAAVSYLAADPAIFYPCTDLQQQLTVRQKYNLGDAPYILSLCTLEPRKNIDHLLRAFARLVREGAIGNTRLVLTGTKGWDFDRIFSEIDNNPELHKRIVLTGYVPDEELAPLYSGAQVFAYMSLYEGFGLPPLEAMQCGTPVITSNTSSLPEVVGDAGIMLDPRDMDGLCQALVRMTTDHELRDDLAQRALKRASLFSWEQCVSDTIAAYKQALGVEPAAAATTPTVADVAKRPISFYCYRPGIDFSLDEQACYILAPLILGTPLEPVCEVRIDPKQWRFHPISHEWRTNPLWAGYRHDADLFVMSESPDEADFFVFPYLLDEMIECAGVQSVAVWLQQLPYYADAAERHLFMTLHDSSEPFGMPSCFFRASIKPSTKDSRACALPYPVEDFHDRCHFDPDKIRFDVSFVGFIGDAMSGPVRRAVVASLQQSPLLRVHISVSERFHGFEEPDVRLQRRELFVESLASSWFVICPRGAGENSYRFFETLSMGRIPVLLSDGCLLPFEESIDYDCIILRIPEHAADRTAEILHKWLASQTRESLIERCKKARKVWEQYLACSQWNHRIIETLRARQALPPIVIDGVIFQLQQGRPFGISRLWQSLLTELGALPIGRRIILLDRAGTAPDVPGIRKRNIGAYTIGTAQDEAAVLDGLCAEEQAALFLSTYYTFTNATPSLLMLYDMIPERFDTVGPHALNPEWQDKYHAIINASAFAAISASTARDLASYYPEVAQRPMAVVPCAVSEVFRPHSAEELAAFRAASGITKPYFLLVGRRDQHKNVALFFQAFEKHSNRADYALVMAGTTQPLEPELRAMAGDAEGYAGFFTDEALSLIYSGAVALVYPSRYEGFGLPILEAMQSGCPVITCQNSSLPEVAGSAALYVEEDAVDEMLQALQAVQHPEVREYLLKRGQQRAAHFGWQDSAGRLVQLIEEVERCHD